MSTAAIGLGCARIGEATGGVSRRRALAMLVGAADAGIGYFDTADAYNNGTSELLVGRALGSRSVTIATKAGYLFRPRSDVEAYARALVGPLVRRLGELRRPRPASPLAPAAGRQEPFTAQDFSVDYLERAIGASCRRLRRDRLDVFQLHAPRGVDVGAVADFARDLVERGRIGVFGVGVEELAEADPWLELDVVGSVQLPFNVLDRRALATIERARAQGVGVVARGVLERGVLTSAGRPADTHSQAVVDSLRELAQSSGWRIESLAIGYVRHHPGIDVALVGTRTPGQVDDLVSVMRAGDPPDGVLAEVAALVDRHAAGG